jgi:hypothetical protein
MSLLQPAKITSAYLKMGILGFQGGGKTKTAGKTAIGLYKYMQSKGIDCTSKPVAFFDTETGSDWLIPDFQQAGVPLVVAKRRSFADLLAVVKEAEAGASALIIDSITHPWRELCESYMRKKQRTFLQIDDWGYLKGDHGWAKFTDLFVNSKLHIIMCGRAGYEFEDYKDDNGKRQIEKVGTKMKTEGERNIGTLKRATKLLNKQRMSGMNAPALRICGSEITICEKRSLRPATSLPRRSLPPQQGPLPWWPTPVTTWSAVKWVGMRRL